MCPFFKSIEVPIQIDTPMFADGSFNPIIKT